MFTFKKRSEENIIAVEKGEQHHTVDEPIRLGARLKKY